MLASKTIAVIIPALNESRLLPETLAGLPHYVDVAVVIDDASTDATAATALTSEAPCRVVVLRHTQNRGVGAAIVTGYQWCLQHKLDIAVVMGADNQMHPDDMPSILLPILRGDADYVTGDRLAWPEGWKEFPRARLFGIVVLAGFTRWATGFPHVRDAQCGYTAITHAALTAIPLRHLYPRYGFPNDMLAKVARAGLHATSRPVRPVYGTEVSALRIHKVIGPILRITLTNRLQRSLAHIDPDTEPKASPASSLTSLFHTLAKRPKP